MSLCRCPMSRWLQRTSWRFSSPASPLWTWGRPTPTSAWLLPASSPSLTAPPPASSVHRLTVSTAFTPLHDTARKDPHLGRALAWLSDKVQTFLFNVWHPLTRVSAHKLRARTPTALWQQMQRLSTSHPVTRSPLKQLLLSTATAPS